LKLVHRYWKCHEASIELAIELLKVHETHTPINYGEFNKFTSLWRRSFC